MNGESPHTWWTSPSIWHPWAGRWATEDLSLVSSPWRTVSLREARLPWLLRCLVLTAALTWRHQKHPAMHSCRRIWFVLSCPTVCSCRKSMLAPSVVEEIKLKFIHSTAMWKCSMAILITKQPMIAISLSPMKIMHEFYRNILKYSQNMFCSKPRACIKSGLALSNT